MLKVQSNNASPSLPIFERIVQELYNTELGLDHSFVLNLLTEIQAYADAKAEEYTRMHSPSRTPGSFGDM